jgi:hypothetical protein
MSLISNLRPVSPPGAGVPTFVSDMIAVFRHMFTLPEVRNSRALKTFVSMMITVAMRCAEALGELPELTELEALVSIESEEKLLAHLETEYGVDSHYAKQHVNYKDKMLDYAHQLQWSCGLYGRKFRCRQAWVPIRAALYGDTEGCITIVDLAEEELKFPSEIDEEFFVRWRLPKPSRSPETVEETEGRFRSNMRKFGFDSLFAKLDLSKRVPAEYTIKEGVDPDTLFTDIDVAVHYKIDEYVAGRPGEERVKEKTTGTAIRTALMEYCGIVINELKIQGITRLYHAFQKDNYIKVIRHLREERRLPADGIRSRLGCLTFLPKTDLFPKGNYSFLRQELNKLRAEPRWRLDERQRNRCILYEELGKVPRRIRASRLKARDLTPAEIGRSLMEEFLTTWPLYLPWRFCMIADCGLFRPAHVNIGYWELTDAMRLDPDLPRWVRKALDHNQHQRFWQFSFGKSQIKNKEPFRDIIPPELVDLYLEYKEYRKYILAKNKDGTLIDDGTLFLNAHGRQLSSQTCRALYRRLVRRWLDVHARPHLTRDAYCEYRLAHGDTLRQIKRRLGHRCYISTDRYCRRYDTSYGPAALAKDRRRRLKAA